MEISHRRVVSVDRSSRRDSFGGMMPSGLEALLILQDRDLRRVELEKQHAAVPGDIAAVERKIAQEQAAIEAAKSEVKAFETRKKLLETEIGSAEDKRQRYQRQQLEVKKNDEYQALGHEIELMTTAIGDLESQEIEVLYAIDDARAKFKTAEIELQTNITGYRERIATLAERKAVLEKELAEVQAEIETARAPVPLPAIRLYDRIAVRQLPAIAAITDGKCGGCHLKVSGEIDSAVRKSRDLVTCDQCGRIVWWERL